MLTTILMILKMNQAKVTGKLMKRQ